MKSFTIRLPGQYFTICPVCDYIREYCRDYIVADDKRGPVTEAGGIGSESTTENTVACAAGSMSESVAACATESPVYFTIATTQSDIDFEREKSAREDTKEGIPIRDLGLILEAIVDAGPNRDIDTVTEQIRGRLSRTITRRFCENGQLRVVTLDAEVEKKILSALTKNEQGVYLALSPDIMQQIMTQLGELRKKFQELSQTPIVLTSQVIRVYLSRMIAQFYPDVYVLSFNEITSSVQIQALGNITLQPKEANS